MHKSRKLNTVADRLAKEGHKLHNNVFVEWVDLPDFARSSPVEDTSSHPPIEDVASLLSLALC